MRLYTLLWLPLLSLGCRDGEPFLPLTELCSELSIDICDARATLCGGDAAGCLVGERERCMAALASYEGEPGIFGDDGLLLQQG